MGTKPRATITEFTRVKAARYRGPWVGRKVAFRGLRVVPFILYTNVCHNQERSAQVVDQKLTHVTHSFPSLESLWHIAGLFFVNDVESVFFNRK